MNETTVILIAVWVAITLIALYRVGKLKLPKLPKRTKAKKKHKTSKKEKLNHQQEAKLSEMIQETIEEIEQPKHKCEINPSKPCEHKENKKINLETKKHRDFCKLCLLRQITDNGGIKND